MFTRPVHVLSLSIALLASTSAHAALISRLGGQAIYDTDLNITWIADANLAQTQTFGVAGISDYGQMNWYAANDWIAAMNAANYLGFSNWRLPTTVQPDISCIPNGFSLFYVGGPGCYVGEMGHLHYDEFGGTYAISYSLDDLADPGDPIELAKFSNIQIVKYWTSTSLENDPDRAWNFSFAFGSQDALYKADAPLHVLAVRDGDVGVVPIPAALWLFGSGLLGLAAIGRKS